MDDHCEKFVDDEENRLEYTTVFKAYEQLVEGELEAGLGREKGAEFSMEEFLAQVGPYLEELAKGKAGPGGDDVAGARTLEVLLTFIHFQEFKDMMLQRKRVKGLAADSAVPDAPDAVVLDEEMEAMVAMAGSQESEWQVLSSQPGLTVERAQDAAGAVFIRTVLLCEGMSVDHAMDMYFNCESGTDGRMERLNWDKQTIWEKVEGAGNEGRFKLGMKLPMVGKLMYDIRVLTRRDFPAPGDASFVYRAVKKDGSLDMKGVCGKGYVKEGAYTKDAATLVTVEELPAMMKYLPRFIVKWMATSFAPKMLFGMKERYIAYRKLGGA